MKDMNETGIKNSLDVHVIIFTNFLCCYGRLLCLGVRGAELLLQVGII